MAESVWITTTTLPDGTFDFFRYMALLENASLLELQMEMLYAELCAGEYEALARSTFGKAGDDMKLKANLYNDLWALIDNEIAKRTDDESKPQYPN